MVKQDRKCTYERNIEARLCKPCFRGKAVSITYSECVPVALVIQDAMRMRRIILSSAACLGPQYFSSLSYERHDFGEKMYLT